MPNRSRPIFRRPSLGFGAAMLFAVLSGGCECGTPEAMLSISSPAGGTTFSLESDVNVDEPGVQIDVSVSAEGLEGELLTLQRNGEPVGRALAIEGEASFEVSLEVGSQVLLVSAREGAVRSDDVDITLSEDPNCGSLAYTTPVAPSEGPLILGAADNTNGGSCETGFETTVVVSTDAEDGTEGRLFINGMPARTAMVSGGVLRFEELGLGLTDNEIAVRVGSFTCAQVPFPAAVRVACEGVDCAIVAPRSESGFLNGDDDVSGAMGFQGDFTVVTEDGAGQPVRLILDGDTDAALEQTAVGGSATFTNLSLSEGVHRFSAECQNAAGDVSRSAPVEYTVDTVPCDLRLEDGFSGRLFFAEDDAVPGTPAVDVLLRGTFASDCSGFRLAVCSGVEHLPFAPFDPVFGEFWEQSVELGSTTAQAVCAQAIDAAGNRTDVRGTARLALPGPLLEIASPAPGTRFNIAGDALHTADRVADNETCEASFEVHCSEVGGTVELLGTDGSFPLGAAECVLDASVPAPYAGRASFASVSLASLEDGATFQVWARQVSGEREGRSAPLALRADCIAPSPVVTRPSCNATLDPETQDEAPGVEGFQVQTEVETRGASVLTLEVRSGDSVVDSATDGSGRAAVVFDALTYGAGGQLSLVATGVDQAGNRGVSDVCTVTVSDRPSLVITSPLPRSVLSDPGTCAGGEVLVAGTTDAANGSEVVVSARGTDTSGVVADGAFSVCADVADGRDVRLWTRVTDSRGEARTGVTVTVDRAVPTDAIDDLEAEVTDRRGGRVRFRWTAVEDAGGVSLAAYEMRCAETPIGDETDWDAAESIALDTPPSMGGRIDAEEVGGFRIARTVHCAIRGLDPAGNLTPVSPSVEVALAFEEETVFGAEAPLTGVGRSVAAIGDVNGDGIPDVAVGGSDGVAVHFGRVSGPFVPPVSANYLRIRAPSGSTATLWRPIGIGDYNGDQFSDFAVVGLTQEGEEANPTGSVYVFFGRFFGTWPPSCQIDGVDCEQDVTLRGTGAAASGAFAASVTPVGDFDGDGLMDLAVGDADAGTVTVLLGRRHAPRTVREVPADTGVEADGFVFANPGAIAAFGRVVGTPGGSIVGDSRPDVLALAAQGTDAVVYALEGQPYDGMGLIAPLTDTAQELFARRDPTPVNGLGGVLTAAGDVDGDGDFDLWSSDDGDGSGAALLFTQDASVFAAPVAVAGATGGAGLARSIAMARHPASRIGSVGDIDADGLADLFIGSVDDADGGDGLAAFFFGAAPIGPRDLATADVVVTGDTDAGERVVAFPGDLNGDGHMDLIVGEPGSSTFTILY